MPTELKFDEKTARALAQAGTKMKPIGIARAYKVDSAFYLNGSMLAGDYIVLLPNGTVETLAAPFVEKCFEPVKKRAKKGKTNAKEV